MSYVCISINKEVVNKEIFTNKQQAIMYFQKLQGEKIREEKEGLKLRLEKSIENYEKRILREQASYEKQKAKVTELYQKYLDKECEKNVAVLQEKKEQKEADLAQLCLDMNKMEVVYEAKYNGYKDNLFTKEPQLILHISGIYQNGHLFTVIDEKYYYIGAKIDKEKTSYSVIKKLPPEFDKNRISLYVFKEIDDFEEIVEWDNVNRIQNTVSRYRNQILRNFQNGPTRMKVV